jgi:chromosome partitioning protein
MLLGGIVKGEDYLVDIASKARRQTIAGYIDERIRSLYVSPKVGSRFVTK